MAVTMTLLPFVFRNLWFGGGSFTCGFFPFPLISYNISFCAITTNGWCHLAALICLPVRNEWKQHIDGILKTISFFSLLESPFIKRMNYICTVRETVKKEGNERQIVQVVIVPLLAMCIHKTTFEWWHKSF